MNEPVIVEQNLPVLSDVEVKESVDKIGAYVNALSASKKAVTDQSVIDEIDEQIRKYSALLIRYRMELGRRTARLEKAKNQYEMLSQASGEQSKKETLERLGIISQRASENERLSANAEEVEKYLARAEEEGRAPTISGALRATKDTQPKNLFEQELKKAKERHDEFVQSDDQIISVTAIMQDRQDMKLIEYDLMQDIYKALSSVTALNITRSHDEILEVARNMSEERLNETIRRIQNAGRVISQILGIFMEVVD